MLVLDGSFHKTHDKVQLEKYQNSIKKFKVIQTWYGGPKYIKIYVISSEYDSVLMYASYQDNLTFYFFGMVSAISSKTVKVGCYNIHCISHKLGYILNYIFETRTGN